MAVEKIHIDHFLSFAKLHPVLDVRSPGEFSYAHIPGAYSLPLFTDEERKVVGTTYKQESREAAIKAGLDFFGPKMRAMVEEVETLCADRRSKTVLVHCWRGGMRSAGVAWLLDLYGFKVYTLVGGYKFFRRWVLQQFEKSWPLKMVGGYTGSGKTELLKQLFSGGKKIIDLESLASHKGSAFGNIGLPPQPSQEMFENMLAWQLFLLSLKQNGNINDSTESSSPQELWVEDESQRIGTVNIPQPFWQQMRRADVYFLDIPFAERLKHITEEYGQLEKQKMVDAINRIQKRLGGLETKMAATFLLEEKIEEAFRILLKYYDKWYMKGLDNRNAHAGSCIRIELDKVDAVENAKTFNDEIQKHHTEKKLIDEPGY